MEAAAGSSGVQKKKMLDQICEAIKDLGKPRSGASVKAIKKHILETYEESQHGRVESQFKKAIAQGEEAGLLVRPAKCKNSVGATGSFLLKKEKLKSVIDKPQKDIDDKTKKVKKLLQSEDSKPVQKLKPKTTKAKIPKKKEVDEPDGESDINHSTPKSSNSEVGRKPIKPRALKKTLKDAEKDATFTMKKHSSESDLTDVKQQRVAKRKNIKEKSKTTKNNKPGTSNSLKDAEKESQASNVKKKTRKALKSYNSDSILM